MRFAFLTGHAAGQPRKASVLLIAEALRDMGHEILIFTTGYSRVVKLLGDKRAPYLSSFPSGRWVQIDGMWQYTHMPLANPGRFPLRILNMLSSPVFARCASTLPNAARERIKDADVVFIESGAGILYAADIKKHAKHAKMIYRASDRLRTLKVHPVIERTLSSAIALFDAALCAAPSMVADLPQLPSHYIPQGVDRALFDKPYANPYGRSQNIISVGDMLFDAAAVELLARYAPDWQIHLFGAGARASAPNIIVHGEQRFEDIVPYLQHADIGLAPYRKATDVDYLSQSSLKMQQYSYVRLPIIAPSFAITGRPNAIAYDPADLATINEAFEQAKIYDRAAIDTSAILSWQQVAQKMLDIL